ncbi:MAG: helix-turn-helix domain-containing protein [Oscillospiraceae bacterium]
MPKLFEYGDILNHPYWAYYCRSDREPFPIRPHWHYYAEILYVLEGSAAIIIDGREYIAHENDLVLFHPEAVHSLDNADPSGALLKCSVVQFDISRLVISNSYSPKLRTIFRAARNDERCVSVFPADTYEHERIRGILYRLIWEMEHMGYGYDLMMHSHLCILMLDILRYWQKAGFSTDSITEADTEDEQTIRSVTEYIDAHSSESLTVARLAELCGMSYSNFAKQFKILYGQSCHEYIEHIRVCKAEDLLLFTNHDLNYISQETGFSDCSHMIKTFRRLNGITPKQFRMKHSK